MGHVKMHGRIVARILVPVEARAREVHDRARGAGLLGRRAVPRVRGQRDRAGSRSNVVLRVARDRARRVTRSEVRKEFGIYPVFVHI